MLFQSYFVIIYQGMFPTVYFLTLEASFTEKDPVVNSEYSYILWCGWTKLYLEN